MKKIFTTLFALMAFAVQAQYLPNSSFDNWKSSCGSTEAFGTGSMSSPKSGEMRQRPGTEPEGWNGSSINQKVVIEKKQQLVYNEGNAVKLQNIYVGAMGIGSVAPGYITLGTPWVYASSTLNDCDGGTYGGASFSYKPDAITGRFKRTDSNGENSYVIAYFWRGTFTSNVGNKNNPNQARDNVDRAILGKVSGSPVGKLIAQCNYSFSSTSGGWQTITIPIEYLNDDTPEMMNVVICGGDYWTRGNMKENTTLLVDDVQFVYNSELASLVYDGTNHFVEGKNSYKIEADYDANKLSLSSNGKGATIQKSYSNDSKVLTVTVMGNDYAVNSDNKHVYTIAFGEDSGVVEPEPEPNPNPDGTVDYTPAFTGAKTKGSRWINEVRLHSNEYADEASNVLTVDNSSILCYNDYTATVEMKAAPGETVTLTINDDDATSWMNAYVYIDADKNGFSASIADGSNWLPAGDLVSYSFYNNNDPYDNNGWNSVGTVISGNDRSTVDMPAFAVPAEAGIYRVRVKLDWCNIDPAGDRDGKFGDFMDNGGQIVDFMLNVGNVTVEPEPEPEPEPTPDEDVDYTPTNTGTRNYAERDITAIKFTGETSAESVYEFTQDERASEYLDLTDAMTVNAQTDEVFSVEIETEGHWVNHYIYIDYDADGFTAGIADGSSWQPAEDLVSYSFYNNGNSSSDYSGWNSDGKDIRGDDRKKLAIPSFAMPSVAGTYRMRIKQDWCSIDPNGDSDTNFGGTFSNYGGQIIDVKLVVTDETGIANVAQDGAVEGIYDIHGRKLEQITAPGLYIVNGKKMLVK